VRITLVTDNPNSWIIPYVKKLQGLLARKNRAVAWVKRHEDIEPGDLAFFLSCEKIVKPETLRLNKHNLVAHPSGLPRGRGWSPLSWQILEGKNRIPITLFEAAPHVDSGRIYLQDYLRFKGHELADELRQQQGGKIIEMVLKFVRRYPKIPKIRGRRQTGRATYYPRRTAADSELAMNKSLAAQFSLLRIVDNDRYPAFFRHRGRKYILKIYPVRDNGGKRSTTGRVKSISNGVYKAENER